MVLEKICGEMMPEIKLISAQWVDVAAGRWRRERVACKCFARQEGFEDL